MLMKLCACHHDIDRLTLDFYHFLGIAGESLKMFIPLNLALSSSFASASPSLHPLIIKDFLKFSFVLEAYRKR